MLPLLLGAAFAAPLDLARVQYLVNNGRQEEARVAAVALLQADPGDPGAHLTWISARASGSLEDAAVVRSLYRSWRAQAPDDPLRALVLAYATGFAARESATPGGSWLPTAPGPWCDEVLGLLDPPAEVGELRARTLILRQQAELRCGRDDRASKAALVALAPEVPHALFFAARFRLEDGADTQDLAVLRAAVEARPWFLDDFSELWKVDARGASLDAARAVLLEVAAAHLRDAEPVTVEAVVGLYRQAKRPTEHAAAAARLAEVDPAHLAVPPLTPVSKVAEALNTPPAAKPSALPSAEERLAAAVAAYEAAASRWARARALTAEAEALTDLGRTAEALRLLHRVHRLDASFDTQLRFARAALVERTRLSAALAAVRDVQARASTPWGRGDVGAAARPKRDTFASAVLLEAQLLYALGRERPASRAAGTAALLQDSPGARVMLGLLGPPDDPGARVRLLAEGLGAGGTGVPWLDQEATAARTERWAASGWWSPAGGPGLSAALAAEPHPTEVAADRPTFPDLELTVAGARRPLSSWSGVVVVDLWATWCGPCKQSLPALDQLARDFPRVTVLAVSVDEKQETAERYLDGSTPHFVSAWAGPSALRAAGTSAIPYTVVLDAERGVVATFRGWSPGSHRLEDTLRTLPGTR